MDSKELMLLLSNWNCYHYSSINWMYNKIQLYEARISMTKKTTICNKRLIINYDFHTRSDFQISNYQP